MNLLKDGKRVIASNLCGVNIPINGMYITYSTSPEKAAPQADINYFNGIKNQAGKGYARVAVTAATPLEDGKIMFTSMLTAEDLIGAPVTNDTILTTATLVHLDEHESAKDLFVYSAVLKNQIKVIPGTYIVVNVGISIGD